jgi:hypothetical protein
MKKPANKTRNIFTLVLFTTLTAHTGISIAMVEKAKENHFKMLSGLPQLN